MSQEFNKIPLLYSGLVHVGHCRAYCYSTKHVPVLGSSAASTNNSGVLISIPQVAGESSTKQIYKYQARRGEAHLPQMRKNEGNHIVNACICVRIMPGPACESFF